ncbi:hypothetical protein DFH28DRAFT_922327 [Melampsora americana]|nr:hypothetical protein DFH28DRAFT_922327 [Melampsora americana]
MPPRSAYRLAVCRCITHGCGQQEYVDPDGLHQRGNRVNNSTAKAHQIADQLHHLSINRSRPASSNQPPSSHGSSPATSARSSSPMRQHEASSSYRSSRHRINDPSTRSSTRQHETSSNRPLGHTSSHTGYQSGSGYQATSHTSSASAGPSNDRSRAQSTQDEEVEVFDTNVLHNSIPKLTMTFPSDVHERGSASI